MQEDIHPKEDTTHFLYSWFIKISRYPFFRQLDLIISLIFIKVAPEIPVDLKKSYTGPDGKRAFIIGYMVTFFFTFVVNTLGSWLNGTLYGNNHNVIYFFEDYWNLALYVFVCPMYVGLTGWLVVLVIKGWSTINEFKNKSILRKKEIRKFKLFKPLALGVLILSVSFFLTTNYINDVMFLQEKRVYYWFFSLEDNKLNALGVYYFLLNFSLLLVTLIALTFFMSIYSLAMKVGKALENRSSVGTLEFEILKEKLYIFTEGYIVTKGIIACYVVNVWIWSYSPLKTDTTANFLITLILLSLIGVCLVSFPRYFIQLQWYKLKVRSPKSKVLKEGIEDLRNFETKLIAEGLDKFFVGTLLVYTVKQILEVF